MTPAITEAFQFFLKNDLKTIWTRIRTQDVPWLVQFGIYGCCGALATVLYIGQLTALNIYVFPGYENMLFKGAVITDAQRSFNYSLNSCIAFVTTNIFTYFMNVLFVFKRGRHNPWVEFGYFTLVNLVSFVISLGIAAFLIRQVGVPTNLAMFVNAVISAFVNFVARKFFVFKG